MTLQKAAVGAIAPRANGTRRDEREFRRGGMALAEWLWNVWPRVTHAVDSITPSSLFAYVIAFVWCLAVSKAFAFFKKARRVRHV